MRDLKNHFWSTVNDIVHNIPNKWLALALRCIVIPFGNPINKPSDKLGKQLAKCLLEPNTTRDRLLQGCYLSANANNPIGQLEIALKHIIAAAPVEKRIKQAIKEKVITGDNQEEWIQQALATTLINDAEAMLLRQAKTAHDQIIAVDSFLAEQINQFSEIPKYATSA